LNLYLRDVLYSRYLCKYFGFNHLEKWLEVPLDSFVAKGIQLDFRPQTLVKFPGIKHLTQEVNQAYQEAAAAIASSLGYARVHLDIIYWRDIGQKGKKSE
jgi:putative heme iron utilization protein